jgi:histidinol-phosphate/aromatic aminotransferase/cobyric acid decarboxylase-like protein/choline kinase
MKAVILAAGFGKRMMPLTASTHKALINIAGRPILSWIVDALACHNITDSIIVTGYRASELEKFMREYHPDHNVEWVHNERYEQTNNIYSLAIALERSIDDDIVLIESDLVFDPRVLAAALESPHDALALVSRYEPGMDGTVVSLSDDVITAIHPPHLQGDNFSFSNKFKTLNIYKFSRHFIDTSLRKLTSFYANSVNDNCYYELVLGVMIYMQSGQINAAIVDTSFWSEIDDPIDVQAAEYKFNPETRLTTLDSTHGAYWNYPVEDFCYVHNAYFPTEGMFSMMRHHLPLLIKSFGSSQSNLDRKLSYFLECDESRIVTLNGTAQLFPWLRDYLSNRKVLIPEPAFGEFRRMFPEASTYDDNVGISIEKFEKSADSHDVITIVNPNNPTGSIVETDYIQEQILKHRNKLFLIDESFIDFSDQHSIIDFLKTREDCENVLVIKSLGKSLGVPGLRVGFAFSNNDSLMGKLRYSLPIWNQNSLAEYFLELLLKNRRNLVESFARVKRARLSLEEKLRTVALVEEVYTSQANFVLARVRKNLCPSEGLATSLLEAYNIYVKDVSSKFSTDHQYVRFAVRKQESNDRLVAALHELSDSARCLVGNR